MIKAVTFDLWNTLLSDRDYTDLRVRYLANVLTEQKTPRGYDEIVEAYISTHNYAHEIWESENFRYVSTEERVNHILRRLRVRLPGKLEATIIKEFKETILREPPTLIRGVKETLEALSLKYRLGIISDTGITPGYILREVLERHRILDLFESTVFSDEIGFNKPHRLMFETALKELDAKPSEAVHVGDLLQTDIAGAKAMGMKTIWINIKRTPPKEKYSPDYEVNALPQVVTVIGGFH